MGTDSKIEWTQSTWNPVTGCTKISEGCRHCYAERMAKRLNAMGQQNYSNGFRVTIHPHMLELPLHWKTPQMIFVNSMSDLFHERVSRDFILRIFSVMNRTHWHNFQVLTKRSDRLLTLSPVLNWTPNIWMGVSVENNDCTFRIEHLRRCSAKLKFLSLEPLLGPLPDLNLEDIDWVIVGGESGPDARPIKQVWVTDIQRQCRASHVPFFFKQWGGTNKKKAGRELNGRTWDEMPQVACL